MQSIMNYSFERNYITEYNMAMSTKIIAHRGSTNNFTENSIEAFKSAIILGAEGIEFDVHMGSDGCLPVYHDYYLNERSKKKNLSLRKT